ncbi:MAG: RluA family pseudouridine synthase [Clostridia bacterium]|nr:RluA family pseudouridine synthase [Clostridia bacterium]
MARTVLLTASENEGRRSLARFLRSRLCASHSLLVKLKAASGVSVNGEVARLDRVVLPGDVISVSVPARWDETGDEPSLIQTELDVPVIYEDEDFVVFNKPAGMPSHPSYGHRDDTLANAFAFRYPGLACRTVTRLDLGTSGAVLIAKNMLSGAIERESVSRIYYGVTDRKVGFRRKTVIAPIEREMPEQPRRIVTPAGKRAVTHISKICEKNGFTLLRFRLETGRTHQIRVHCAALGLPLCGDLLYGGTEGDIDRPALHMAYLSLINPITGKRISACAKLPEDIKKLLE